VPHLQPDDVPDRVLRQLHLTGRAAQMRLDTAFRLTELFAEPDVHAQRWRCIDMKVGCLRTGKAACAVRRSQTYAVYRLIASSTRALFAAGLVLPGARRTRRCHAPRQGRPAGPAARRACRCRPAIRAVHRVRLSDYPSDGCAEVTIE
jgi:hypothetical protein